MIDLSHDVFVACALALRVKRCIMLVAVFAECHTAVDAIVGSMSARLADLIAYLLPFQPCSANIWSQICEAVIPSHIVALAS